MTNVVLAGAGAFGIKHLDGIERIDGVRVTGLVGRRLEATKAVADESAASIASRPTWTRRSAGPTSTRSSCARRPRCTPTRRSPAWRPASTSRSRSHWPIRSADARRVAEVQKATGKVCMVGHTRRFNPSHQWVNRRLRAGDLTIQQMDVQTFFFRRKNMNALGEPRSWTDHLLWHHAAHTVDLFQYQTGERVTVANAVQGPIHPELGIAMDLSIQLKTEGGAICTLSLSFNNDGPLGTFFRYIGDTGTYIARYDDLVDGKEEPIDVSDVDVSMNGIELQDREFFASIAEGRMPNSSVHDVLPCYEVLDRLERQLEEQAGAAAP